MEKAAESEVAPRAPVDSGEPAEDEQKVRLESNDVPPKSVAISRKAINLSEMLKTMLADLDGEKAEVVIPLPNVDGVTLELIVEWAEHHKNDPAPFEKRRVNEDDSEDSDSDDDEQDPEVSLVFTHYSYFVFVMHSWGDRRNYGTDDVMLTVTPVSPRMHYKNDEPNLSSLLLLYSFNETNSFLRIISG